MLINNYKHFETIQNILNVSLVDQSVLQRFFYIQYLIVFKCGLFIYYHLFLVKLYYFMY